MRLNANFSAALQILVICYKYPNDHLTSLYLAKRISAPDAVLRRIMADLRRNNMIYTKPGPSPIKLLADLNEVSLYDVYVAVNHDEDNDVIKCYSVGSNADNFDALLLDSIKSSVKDCVEPFILSMKQTKVISLIERIDDTL